MEITGFTTEVLVLLFAIAVMAGFLDTLAGGGGLISLPALILAGVPPLFALGTNKLQGSVGTATATYMMLRSGMIKWPKIKTLMITAFLGAALGTLAVQFINTDILSFVIPLVLFLIAVYFLASIKPSKKVRTAKVGQSRYQNLVVPGIGFYDGMFGPGTGSFFSMAGIVCRAQDLISSTASAKALNFATNIASLIVFVAFGKIVWSVGAVMMLGQMIGAWLGAHSLVRINPIYLRCLVVIICVSMLIKYCHANF